MNEPVRRLSRIFRQEDGRAFIVALDHGLTEGPVRGLESPDKILNQIVTGGADAVLTSYGTALRFDQLIAPLGLILRLDVGGSKIGKMGPGTQFYQVEDALRLGADAVAVSAFPGLPEEPANLRMLASVVSEAHRWNMPVMAEMQPGGFDAGPEFSTTENIAISARIAAELGSDWVKVPYAAEFSQVTRTCYVPIVVLGGSKTSDDRAFLRSIQDALDAGAAGVAIGRNIFQAENPLAMTKAIAAMVHRNAGLDEALSFLRSS
jgi:DhnA family fructose-bisphosphate aldolase class Ia